MYFTRQRRVDLRSPPHQRMEVGYPKECSALPIWMLREHKMGRGKAYIGHGDDKVIIFSEGLAEIVTEGLCVLLPLI
jgi:hypothetical protein